MRLSAYLLIISCALPAVSGAQQVCVGEFGEVICSKGVVDDINANGVAKIKGTEVEYHTQVNGSLRATNAKFASLTVNGDATIKKSTVKAEAKINGSLNIDDSQLLSNLILTSNHAVFKKSQLKNIMIKKTNSPKQTIKLIATTVKGDVSFENESGIVYLCENSKVEGKIIGGKAITKCKKGV